MAVAAFSYLGFKPRLRCWKGHANTKFRIFCITSRKRVWHPWICVWHPL